MFLHSTTSKKLNLAWQLDKFPLHNSRNDDGPIFLFVPMRCFRKVGCVVRCNQVVKLMPCELEWDCCSEIFGMKYRVGARVISAYEHTEKMGFGANP